jgi:dihydrofolate synthase/folylpolyglutamate synthase
VKDLGYQHQLQGNDCGSVANAYRQAMTDAAEDDFIFVGGSSYIVADFLSIKHF